MKVKIRMYTKRKSYAPLTVCRLMKERGRKGGKGWYKKNCEKEGNNGFLNLEEFLHR